MTRKGARVCASVASFALALAPGAAWAFCRTSACADGTGARCLPAKPSDCGAPLWWPSTCVQLTIAKVGSSQIDAETAKGFATEALAAWTSVDCGGGSAPSITVEVGPLVACGAREYNEGPNASILAFRDDAWPYENADSTLALTTLTYEVDTGKILDADLEVNSHTVTFSYGQGKVETDLLSVLTHEAGHFLGLGHSSVPGATMVAEYFPGQTTPRTLEADDQEAICAAYPPDDPRVRPCDPTPPGGFSEDCQAGGGKGCGCTVGGAGAEGPLLAALTALIASTRRGGRRRRG